MMQWICSLFYETTDPQTPYMRLLYPDVWANVLIHAFIYSVVFCVLLSICQEKKSIRWGKLISIWIGLIILMMIGYMARLCRVKCLAKTLESEEEAKRQIRNAYFVWYFIG